MLIIANVFFIYFVFVIVEDYRKRSLVLVREREREWGERDKKKQSGGGKRESQKFWGQIRKFQIIYPFNELLYTWTYIAGPSC